MPDTLELRVDKFIFKVALDRYYSGEGVWIKVEGQAVRIGISDYLQQRSGDVAFVEVKPEGSHIILGDEIAVMETIKVNISLGSPVSGKVIEVNAAMGTTPEVINQDPYGEGWIALIEAEDRETSLDHLMDPQAYFAKIKGEAEQEARKE